MAKQRHTDREPARLRPAWSITLVALMIVFGSLWASAATTTATPATVAAPVLKWQRGGCGASSCEQGWYNSPAVADLDGDGEPEIIWAASTVFALNGSDGSVQWAADPVGGRSWPSVAVADLEGDGTFEVMTGHEDGFFHIHDHTGSLLWSRQPYPASLNYEIRSVAVADLEVDGDLEVVFANTFQDDQWWVYEHNGVLRAGDWPQHEPDGNLNGYTRFALNQNIGIGDVDGDGRAEIIGSTNYANGNIPAFHDDGTQMLAHEMYGANPDGSNRVWSRVRVFEDHALDLNPTDDCRRGAKASFGYSPPTVADVNGDGVYEIVIVSSFIDCGDHVYEKPFILNADRTRWAADGYDWTVLPATEPDSAPLSQDESVIELSMPNAVAADLDGDGLLEILYASYDGRVHAYWLDRTQHGDWPYPVYDASEGFYRFASEPVVVDLDGDGLAEVLFASWPEKGGNRTGKLHIVNYLGELLHEVPLPAPFGGNWNGGLAAPTVDNADGDPDMEVVLGTARSGVVVYDLPGTSGARPHWPTGRGSYLRAGLAQPPTVPAPPEATIYMPLAVRSSP
ncbi:MAG: VCBS repeat-containing protein [Chloroflexi bacterium]|nr:VCBS repeat-containing protein [Chloroflexota bacterium]